MWNFSLRHSVDMRRYVNLRARRGLAMVSPNESQCVRKSAQIVLG